MFCYGTRAGVDCKPGSMEIASAQTGKLAHQGLEAAFGGGHLSTTPGLREVPRLSSLDGIIPPWQKRAKPGG